MIRATFPSELEQSENVMTLDGVARATGLPLSAITSAIETGELPAHSTCGMTVVQERNARAWAASKCAGRCIACED